MNKQIILLAMLFALTLIGCEDGFKISNPFSSPEEAPAATIDSTEPALILRDYHGNDAGFAVAGVTVIDSAEELEARGSTQLGQLGVDFENEMVVVFALGEQPGWWVVLFVWGELSRRKWRLAASFNIRGFDRLWILYISIIVMFVDYIFIFTAACAW